MPLISIIIPVYNVEHYLSKCIGSILAQLPFDLEILLVDDGSTDNSANICDKYAKKYSEIKVYHKINGGVGSARNLGLEVAKGKYIVFLDADDWFDINMFEKICQITQIEHPDMIQFGYYRISENDEIISSYQPVVVDKFCLSFEDYAKLSIYQGGMCNFLIKREIIENAHIRFSDNIKYAEDGEFMFKCAYCSKNIYVCSDVFYYYLIRRGSATQIKFTINGINDHLIVLDNLFSFINNYKSTISPFFQKELIKQLTHYLICFSLMKCSRKDFKSITNVYKQFVDKHINDYPQIVCGRFEFRLAYFSMFLFVLLTRVYIRIKK